MKKLLKLLPFLAFAVTALGDQRVARTVATVTEMLAIPPERLAASTVGTNTAFLAVVVTTGDTAAGTGNRVWMWEPSSSAVTNTVANGGPMAYPYGASTGRWLWVRNLGQGIGLTANRVLITDGSGNSTNSTTDSTALALLAGGVAPFQLQIDALGGGGTSIRIVNSMADLVTLAATTSNVPQSVFLKGYHAGFEGVGAGVWNLVTNSTYATNRAVIAAAVGGRYMPVWDDGKIDITRFGARRNITDDQAWSDAIVMQQDPTYQQGKAVFMPFGEWPISRPLSNNYVTVSNTTVARPFPLLIWGSGRGYQQDGLEANRYVATSTIRQMTTNTPIIQFGGHQNEFQNYVCDWNSFQNGAGNSQSVAFQLPALAADSGRNRFENISVRRAYRFFDAPLAGGSFFNNTFKHIYTHSVAGGAFRERRGGTINYMDNIYFQNGNFPTGGTLLATIDETVAPVLVGTNLTFTLRSVANNWPTGLGVGHYCEVGYAPTRATPNGGHRFTTATNYIGPLGPNTFTIAVTSAEAASLTSSPPMPVSGDYIYINNGGLNDNPMFEVTGQWVVDGLDIELTRINPSMPAWQGGLIECVGCELSIEKLHFEGIVPTVDFGALVHNWGGRIRIGDATAVNITLPPGLTVYGFKNEATTFGGSSTYAGPLIVDTWSLRDGYAGGSFTTAFPAIGATTDPHINWNPTMVNFRVAGRSVWPIGDATKNTIEAW